MEVQKVVAQQVSEEVLKRGYRVSSMTKEDYRLLVAAMNMDSETKEQKSVKERRMFQKSLSSSPYTEKMDKELKAKISWRKEKSHPDDLIYNKNEKEIKMVVFNKDKTKKEKESPPTRCRSETSSPIFSPPAAASPTLRNRGVSLSRSAEFVKSKFFSSSTKIFNMSLEDGMAAQKSSYPHLDVPIILHTLTEAIIAKNGTSLVALFN